MIDSRFRGSVLPAKEAATSGNAQIPDDVVEVAWDVKPSRGTLGAAIVVMETLEWPEEEGEYLTAEDDPVLAELWNNKDDAIFDEL